MLFADRREAGRLLAEAIGAFGGRAMMVVAVHRGGIPVGYEIATRLGSPMEVVFVGRIGAPGYPELTLGAFVDSKRAEVIVDHDVLKATSPAQGYLEFERKRRLVELTRERAMIGLKAGLAAVAGKPVVIVDDGAASGCTAKAAIKSVVEAGAERIVLALPVAPVEVIDELSSHVDQVFCLSTPVPFGYVGHYYKNFRAVSAEEIAAILANHASTPLT